ncbi:hypothetical protein AB1Y20_020979 [Prymnesium parvum]|uniref:Phospholipase/carboxylesterase/thioesterase domain-containing protein n=1 Tax=Prymnesium parvum TaxID=97485 RepID=A0AB34JKS1_PRYPA
MPLTRPRDRAPPAAKRPKRAAAAAASQAWRHEFEEAPLLVFPSLVRPATAGIICLHGLADSPEAWARVLEDARARHPSWSWMFPGAPERPITAFEGKLHAAWGDFDDEGIVRVGSADYESSDRRGWYAASAARVHRAVCDLVDSGIPYERIALVGASQGGALAAHVALTLRERLGGWVIMSGWLLPEARLALPRSPNARGARVLVCHSTADDEVEFGCARECVQLLQKAGARVEFEVIEGQSHANAEAPARRRMLAFLDDIFGDDTA